MKEQRIQNSLETWNTIAESFHHTRKHPWKICLDFILSISKTSICADLACGNGRHLIPLSRHCQQSFGFDISNNLLSIVSQQLKKENIQNCSLIQGDLCELPFSNSSFDHILYIAALHNIKHKENRIKSLHELRRILKPKGTALITVWSKYQARFKNKKIPKEKDAEIGDTLVYWRQHQLNIARFYHLYDFEEFKQELSFAELKIIQIQEISISSSKNVDNYFAIVQKN